jgi:hypothetical protein
MRTILAGLLILGLAVVAEAQTTTLTLVCTDNADGVTKDCVVETPYDGVSRYSAAGSASLPTGETTSFSASIVPMCGPVTIDYPAGKVRVKWAKCAKALQMGSVTLTKQ